MPPLVVHDIARPIGRAELVELIQRNEPLSRHTSLLIGGPGDYFASPRTLHEVEHLLAFAEERGLSWSILGNGTNTLFPDEGYLGLIIHLGRNFSAKRIEEDHLIVQAGASLGATMGYLRTHGFYDFDGLVGIPGTVGGAVAMDGGIHEVTL